MTDKQYRLFKMIITILFGWLGFHKFMDKKYILGIVYLFTFGLFFFGWLYDICISIAEFISVSKQTMQKDSIGDKTNNNYTSQQHIASTGNVKPQEKLKADNGSYQQMQKAEIQNAPGHKEIEVVEKADISKIDNDYTSQQRIASAANVKLREKQESENSSYQQTPKIEIKKYPANLGYAVAEEIDIDITNIEDIKKEFIAFDVETTGFSPKKDRIIELGAVLFKNGKSVEKFSSLVNAGVPVPKVVERLTHITNEMVQNAEAEDEVYKQFLDFIDRSVNGNIVMCAHNAQFDFTFLCNTMARLGYELKIKFVDTLSLSRNYLKDLENHKQITLESYFGLDSSNSHRAVFDAENCGKILVELLNYADEEAEAVKRKYEKFIPSKNELYICAYVQKLISEKGGNTELIRFKHNGGNYIEIKCFNTIAKIKCLKKESYILVDKNIAGKYNFRTEPCTQSEGNNEVVRLLFNTPFELELLADYFYSQYLDCFNDMNRYFSLFPDKKHQAEIESKMLKKLSDSEICELLDESKRICSQRQLEEEKLLKEKQRKEEEKALKRAQREAIKEEQKSNPIQSQGRAVIQLDDNGVVIAEYKAITEAAIAVNSNSKSIREAANGRQKHAAGYCWKYKD